MDSLRYWILDMHVDGFRYVEISWLGWIPDCNLTLDLIWQQHLLVNYMQ
jgi:hypothetical protein